MFKEHEPIGLTADLTGDDGEELRPGDVGDVVHVHLGGEAYVVEFQNLDGGTAVIATVPPSQARRVTRADMIHARHVEIPA